MWGWLAGITFCIHPPPGGPAGGPCLLLSFLHQNPNLHQLPVITGLPPPVGGASSPPGKSLQQPHGVGFILSSIPQRRKRGAGGIRLTRLSKQTPGKYKSGNGPSYDLQLSPQGPRPALHSAGLCSPSDIRKCSFPFEFQPAFWKILPVGLVLPSGAAQ